MMGATGRGIKRKLSNPKTYDKALKGTLKLLSRGMGVLTGVGTAALGFGFSKASGEDMVKSLQTAAATGFGGYQAGKATSDFVNQGVSNMVGNAGTNAAVAFEQGSYDDANDYYAVIRQREAKRKAEEILNDDRWIEKYARISGQSIPEARRHLRDNRELLEKGIGFGFSDANEFAAVEAARAPQYNVGIDADKIDDHAFKLAKLVKDQSSTLATAEDNEEVRENLRKSYLRRMKLEPDSVAADSEANQKAEKILNDAQEINHIYMKQ